MKRELLAAGVSVLWLSGCTINRSGGDAISGDGDARGGDYIDRRKEVIPTYGSVRVGNPYQMPVRVQIGSIMGGVLAPGQYTSVTVPAGEHTVMYYDPYNRYIGEETIETGMRDRHARTYSRTPSPHESPWEDEEGDAEEHKLGF